MAKIRNRDWVEPAHPVIVQRFDDLINIYRFLKDAIQQKLDSVFDSVSRQIGFVVTTTLPVSIDIADGGKIARIEVGVKNLQGTIFEREFAPIFKELTGKSPGKVAAGNYPLYLLWHEALKIKLKADWIEPAHFIRDRFRQEAFVEAIPGQFNPAVREPAHWFDAGIALAREEEILISAIDEVYTDLRLAERVAVARRESMKFVPGIREPAHLIPGIREPAHFVPGIREPAHFRKLLEQEDFVRVLSELADMLRKHGM